MLATDYSLLATLFYPVTIPSTCATFTISSAVVVPLSTFSRPSTSRLFIPLASAALRILFVGRRCNEERLHAHVDQSRNGAGSVVGMQRGEDQVTGECRLNGDFGHFQVANFADENNIGRLTQHRPQNLRERKPDVLFHLTLIDP